MERMGRFRRSLRDSFRKKRDSPESSKPHQWQADEEAVRGGNSSFHVKYLGSVEVYESRGMPVCEEAMKVLRQTRRRPVKAILHISGDGLRLVEDETKGLILDQTIEKVSFCAPDRNHERGFSYICRDGTTRRWMCHGFLATKDSGERLSHAVGCAFAACLERKQKREKECGVSMTYDSKTSTFTRSGSFRVSSLTDSLSHQSSSPPPTDNVGSIIRSSTTANTHASEHMRERPHAPVKMLERQGSFRGFSHLANQSPFKRQLSLRLNDLPSNLQRTQQNHDILDLSPPGATNGGLSVSASTSPAPPPRTQRNRLHSLPNNSLGGAIPESSLSGLNGGSGESGPNLMRLDSKDLVTELCQQVTQGLSLLAANHDEEKNSTGSTASRTTIGKFTNPWDDDVERTQKTSNSPFSPLPNLDKSSNINRSNFTPQQPVDNSWIQNIPGQFTFNRPTSTSKIWTQPISSSSSSSPSKLPLSVTKIKENVPVTTTEVTPPSSKSNSLTYTSSTAATPLTSAPDPSSHRPPLVSAMSVQQPSGIRPSYRAGLNTVSRSQSLGADPFDADWANSAARTGQTPTNPFARPPPPQQTFQIHL